MEMINNEDTVVVDVTEFISSNKKGIIRVLHVDDDCCFLEVSKQILSMETNFEIDVAASVDEAIEKMEIKTYDVIVSDYEMPQKNGLEFLKNLRDRKISVPFVLFTGKGREDVAVKALNLGADRYINKNGSPETVYCELVHAINKTVDRKRSEDLLAKSESNYRMLVEESLQGILVTLSSPLRLIFANESMGKILGYSPQELLSLSPEEISNLIHCDDRAIFFGRMENRLRGKPAEGSYEFRAVRKDGALIWLNAYSNRVDYDGQPAVQGMFIDINENKKTREILIESEQRYRELANSLPNVVFETDINGKLVFANQRAAEISGYSQEELEKGLNILQFIAPEDKERAIKSIRRLLAEGSYVPTEYGFIRKNGTSFPALITATPCICGKKMTGLRGVVLDITERKNTEEILRKSEARYRELANSLPQIVFECEANGRLTFFNRQAFEITGYSPEEFDKGLNIMHFLAIEDREKATKNIQKVFAGQDIGSNEYRIMRKDGGVFPALIKTLPVSLENGQRGLRGIVLDISDRKKSEQALLEQKEKAESYLNIVGNVVLALDSRGKITLLNKKGYEILGYQEGELEGKDWVETCLPFSVRTELKRVFESWISEGSAAAPMHFENSVVTKNGEERLIRWNNTLLKGRNGEVTGTLSSGDDVTEQMRAEALLKESEEKFRNLAEESPNMIFINKRGSVVYANKQCEETTGYSREEVYAPGFDFLTLTAIESREALTQSFKRHMEGVETSPYEIKLVTKGGKKIDAICGSKLIRYAGDTAILGIVTDISESKEMEARLKLERDTLEAVTENIGAGLLIVDKEYKILWSNNYIARLIGDLDGETCYSAISQLPQICPDCGVKKVFQGAPFDAREYFNPVLFGQGKSTFWFEIIVTPIRDENGDVKAALELTVDITNKKLMQEKLSEYSEKLEKIVDERTGQLRKTQAKLVKSERLAAIGELAGMVGHDLRNPLAAIMASVYYLRNHFSAGLNENNREMLHTIDQCIVYSDKIVNDLLEYSREINLELNESTPKELLQETLLTLEIPSSVKIIDETQNEPKILVDKARLKRVFLNLAKNSFDSMPIGGTLSVSSKISGLDVEITFADTGIGMTKDVLEKLWTPLFTTKAKGMGFGLAVCKRFVEAHGGKIGAKSTPNKGTSFTLRIPIKTKTSSGLDE